MSREGPGSVIGRYKLLQELGEGGFGTVYQAEQVEPVRRHVALKIIKLGMDSKQVVARFEAERQALALMDHPHIAKVLDAGATDSGRPYFVMELVKGISITEYCDQARLDTAARLDLFVAVCHAVQHAHQKGVIHRDLKPNNILVALHDGKPVPKVIDFGIAKATAQRLTEKTLFTEFRQWIGTPEYMAPEQAEMSGLDVDTRADVYSLGVLLYELLTGTKPFDLKALLADGYEAVLRTIREVDPPRPSTRVSTMDHQSAVPAPPRAELRQLRGELDWIVMKALEKDRSRRYETANGLAADIGRYLAHEPVAAGPPGALYRARKYMRRNVVGVAAAAAVVVALLTGTVFAVTGYMDAARRRDEAEASWRNAERDAGAAEKARAEEDEQRERAEREEAAARGDAAKANAVLELTDQMLGAANPASVNGPNYTVREVLRDFERELPHRLKDQPEVEATLRHQVGSTYVSLGLSDQAETHLKRVLELRRQPSGMDEEYAKALVTWSVVKRQRAQYVEAEKAATQALAILSERLGAFDVWTAAAQGEVAQVALARGQYRKAAKQADAALEGRRRAYGDDHALVARSLTIRAVVARAERDHATALELLQEALATSKRLRGENHPDVGGILDNIGGVYLGMMELDKAEEYQREALRVRASALGDKHASTGTALHNLAIVLRHRGQWTEAEALYRKSIAVEVEALGADHETVARTRANYGALLEMRGRFREAREQLAESIAVLRKRLRPRHPQVLYTLEKYGRALAACGEYARAEEVVTEALDIARDYPKIHRQTRLFCETNLANVRMAQGRYAEAESLLRPTLPVAREIWGPESDNVANVYCSLAACAKNLGRLADAERHYEQSLGIYRQVGGEEHPQIARVLGNMVSLYTAQGDPKRAFEVSARSLARFRKLHEGDHPDLAYALHRHGPLLFQKDPKAGFAMLRDALAMRRRILGDEHPETAASWNGLGIALTHLGRFADADSAFRKARAVWVEALGPSHHRVALADRNLGWSFLFAGRYDEAATILNGLPDRTPAVVEMLAQCYSLTNRFPEAEAAAKSLLVHGRTDGRLAILGEALLAQDKFAEAAPILKECLGKRAKSMPGKWLHYNAMSMYGAALAGLGKHAEAEPLLREAFEKIKPPKGLAFRRDKARERLAKLYEAWGKPEQAAKYK